MSDKKPVRLFKSRDVTTLGIDIGSYSLKCVEMSFKDSRLTLEAAHIQPLKSSAPEALADALRAMPSSASQPPKRVRISVAGPPILIRQISLPRMTAEELKGAIRFEAERHIPFSLDDCILDCQILGKAANKTAMKVLLVAAKKDFIQQQLKTLNQAGLEPEIIDAEIFCFVNAFMKLSQMQDQKTFGLLNIGHELSSFAVVHDGELFFVREMPTGGRSVTKALAGASGLAEEAAEELKKKRDPEGAPAREAATRLGFETLEDELRRSIDYFENETGGELKTIYTAGGGARSESACKLLTDRMERTFTLWENSKPLEVGGGADAGFLRAHHLELCVAQGLALRGLG